MQSSDMREMAYLADRLIGIQEDLPDEDDRNALGEAAHYLRGTLSHPVPTANAMAGRELPSPETMLTYASILEKPQYYIHTDRKKYRLATGEIIEAACAALRYCAALTPKPPTPTESPPYEGGTSGYGLESS